MENEVNHALHAYTVFQCDHVLLVAMAIFVVSSIALLIALWRQMPARYLIVPTIFMAVSCFTYALIPSTKSYHYIEPAIGKHMLPVPDLRDDPRP